jgi:hypothetical protein
VLWSSATTAQQPQLIIDLHTAMKTHLTVAEQQIANTYLPVAAQIP